MTDAEIIKALENHLSDEGECSECAYFENIGSCVGIMHKDLYDLINRQKAEGENQSENFKVLVSDHRTLQQSFDNLKGLYEAEKAKVEKAKEKCVYFAKEVQKARAETDRVTAIGAEWKEAAYTYADNIDRIKSEAIKEVLLQLEAEAESSDKYIQEYDDSETQKAYNKGLWTAYNLVKEMVGDTE